MTATISLTLISREDTTFRDSAERMYKKITKSKSQFFLFTNLTLLILLSVFLTTTKVSAATPCKLSLSVTSDKTSVTRGDTVTRTFTVKNTGRTTCRSTSYSVFYGANESFVSSNPAPTASNYYFYVGNLGANKRDSITVTTRQISSSTDTEITTEACASATGVADSCVASIIPITQSIGVVATSTPVVTEPIVVPIVSTSTTSTSTTVVINPVQVGVKEKGIWIWNFPSQMNTTTGFQQLQTLSSYGFNSVYVTIDDYLDIAIMADGTAKTSAKATYFANLSKVITKANSLGIAVDAEGGWRDWAYSTNRWKGFALIDAVKEYNTLYPNAKLRGFQYDVEPYILPEYETNKATVLTDYVTFIDQSVARFAGSDVKFSIVIPHFYDDVNAWTPKITYNGVSAFTYNHLLTILEKKQGSKILIMSYRDFFEGTNGTRDVSETEIKEASNGFHTQVIVSQETGNVDPSYVTYYGSTKAVLFGALDTINTAFGNYSQYGGTAVHYMDSFFALQ